jgi:hypothetical protein
MLRDEAIRAATAWLRSRDQEFGGLRLACYRWDYRSGCELWGRQYTRGLVTIPTLGNVLGAPRRPLVRLECYRLVHGWSVVFDPSGHLPEGPEDCFAVWVPEAGGPVRCRQPRCQEFELTFPLTGGLWREE